MPRRQITGRLGCGRAPVPQALACREVPPGDRRPRIQYSRDMTTWEYLTAPVLVHSTKQILDNFGADGWELVQIVPGMNPENLVAYFKRPVNG